MGIQKEMPLYLKRVFSLIPQHGRVKVADIAKVTGMSNKGVREAVRELIFRYDKPIGTDNSREKSGYFIITTEAEREAAARNLESRAKEISARALKIREMSLVAGGE